MEVSEHCYELLNNSSRSEEDRIDDVEAYVHEKYRETLSEDEIERLVLDILLQHQAGKPASAVARPRVVAIKASNPVRLPDAEQARQEAIAQKQQKRKKQKPKQKWVSLEEFTLPEPTREAEPEKSPYDMLRGILGADANDEDIERVLAHNEFDIGRTVDMLLGTLGSDAVSNEDKAKEQLLTRDQTAERVMCKYYLKSGSCMRGDDCMYSHDISQRICRFWLQNKCLAGDNCVFLHEIPAEVIAKLSVSTAAPQTPNAVPILDTLPTLGTKRTMPKHAPKNASPAMPTTPPKSVPKFDFAAALKAKDTATGVSDADVKKLSIKRGKVAVVLPRQIPWDHLDDGVNQQYVDMRLAAKKNGELRNRYLELATTSWSKNDPAAAKAFSKKGQDFHRKMVAQQIEAGDLLFEHRKDPGSEIYVDLHGHELGAAVDMLEERLQLIEETEAHDPRVVYVICGRGHFKLKRYADQLSQHVKVFLDKYGYAHKDFGEKAMFGRIIGVDPWSAYAPNA